MTKREATKKAASWAADYLISALENGMNWQDDNYEPLPDSDLIRMENAVRDIANKLCDKHRVPKPR